MKSSTKQLQPNKPNKIISLLWVSVAGLLASSVSILLTVNLPPVLANECSGSGFGCAVGGVFVAMLFGLTAAVAVSGMILCNGRLRQPKSVGFLTAVPSYVTIIVLSLLYEIFTNTYIMYLFIGSVFLITFIIHNLILVRLNRWNVRLIAVIILCMFYIWPVMHFSMKLSSDRYQTKVDIAGRNTDFDLYLPAPRVLGQPVTISSYYPQFESNQGAYYEISYGLQNGNISLYQFKVPLEFNPPFDCLNEKPKFLSLSGSTNPCVEIGKSKSGCTVYAAKPAGTNSYETYCQLGNTLLTTHIASFYNNSNFKDKDAIALYDSLQMSNYDSLKALSIR